IVGDGLRPLTLLTIDLATDGVGKRAFRIKRDRPVQISERRFKLSGSSQRQAPPDQRQWLVGLKFDGLVKVRNGLVMAVLLEVGVGPEPIGLRHLPSAPPAFLDDGRAS